MKSSFLWCYRLCLALCVVGMFWAVWASAQTNTNSAAASTNAVATVKTNEPGSIERKLSSLEEKLSERDLLFHLDKVTLLRENTAFGQPLWKYIASLIYIFCAFYISKI